jgi:hypothetical protein
MSQENVKIVRHPSALGYGWSVDCGATFILPHSALGALANRCGEATGLCAG